MCVREASIGSTSPPCPLFLSLPLARALFSSSEPQTRAARSIRIDCPWRAAPLSSQCQPVCDREGEKWRKISAALAVSFPHTSVGRLPADRTFKRSGVDWEKPGAERPQLTPVYHSRPHYSWRYNVWSASLTCTHV